MENNSYIYVYDFPQKNFSMCHGTYSPIPDPSKNWSVKLYMNWPKNLPGGLSSYGRTMMPVNHPVPIISLVYFVQPFSLLLDLHCIRTQNNKVCTTKFSFNRNCKQILAIKNMYKWSHRKVHSLKCERRTSSQLHQCHCLC